MTVDTKTAQIFTEFSVNFQPLPRDPLRDYLVTTWGTQLTEPPSEFSDDVRFDLLTPTGKLVVADIKDRYASLRGWEVRSDELPELSEAILSLVSGRINRCELSTAAILEKPPQVNEGFKTMFRRTRQPINNALDRVLGWRGDHSGHIHYLDNSVVAVIDGTEPRLSKLVEFPSQRSEGGVSLELTSFPGLQVSPERLGMMISADRDFLRQIIERVTPIYWPSQ